MPEPTSPNVTVNQPVNNPNQVAQPQTVPQAQEPDLITKVSQFKKQNTQAPIDNQVDIGFDFKEIEAIKDPVAKEQAMRAYKSMQAGATKKFQEIAQVKKQAEESIKSMEQKLEAAKNWSPERIQRELLNNPQFIEAAQQISAQNNNNNDSLLSEEDKAKINGLESEIMQLKQSNYQSLISQEDSLLQSKYADYSPHKVDETIAQLSKLQPYQIREWVYRAIQHDDHVKASYELGKQESLKLNQERVNAFSLNGGQTINNIDVPKKEPGESDQNFFSRLYQSRKSQIVK